MKLLYVDEDMVVCLKPAGVRSTDEPGGVPELVRAALGDPKADVRTVHRLDQVVSGVMVLARGKAAASELSRQIRENAFHKTYLAVVHGLLPDSGTLRDLLTRDKARRMTFVTQTPGKDAREAVLHYQTRGRTDSMSLAEIQLETGRTHQIRVQFSSRGFPLMGERKYSLLEDSCSLALWSYRLAFSHPRTGAPLVFSHQPPETEPWCVFLEG